MKPQVTVPFPATDSRASYPALDSRCGVVVVDGYGIRIAVERGHLTISDGAGSQRRERRIAKVGHGIRRLVVIGHTGTISFDALRWLDRLGIHFTHIDSDGTLLTASTNESAGNARLRRAQVLAHNTPAGNAIVKELLDAKLAGQTRNLRNHLRRRDLADLLDAHRRRLADAATVVEAREIESIAALDYFSGWNDVGLRWATRDQYLIPDHWRSFTTRRSLIAKSTNARASDPINAILNYLYALGEIECRRACLVLGLDPGLGFLHADTQTRDSLALDLIEAIRPDIDAYVLKLADAHIFTARDFTETPDGHCRSLPPLTHQLATTLPDWERAVAPWAEHVAHAIADTSIYAIRKAKPLTGTVRRATSTERQADKRKPDVKQRARASRTAPPLAKTCQHCGTPLKKTASMYCSDCLPTYRKQSQQRGVANAAARLADPDVRSRHKAAISKGRLDSVDRAAAALGQSAEDWNGLAPRVSRMSLRQIMDATGLAISHASRIKSGKYRPHPRHWSALHEAMVIETNSPSAPTS